MAFIPVGGIVKLSQKGRLVYGEVSREPQLVEMKNGGYFSKFGIVAGANSDGEKQFVDCKAFGKGLVAYCKDLARGDPICAIGDLESREYNGKTYWDLKLAWVNSPSVVPDLGDVPASGAFGGENTSSAPGDDAPKFYESDDEDDGELPF